MSGVDVRRSSLVGSIEAMIRGCGGGVEEKALPQRHRDTETGTIYTFLKLFSVSLCLCGKACLFRKRIYTPNLTWGILRHGLLVVTLLLLAAWPVLAVEPAEQLKNPALEARARHISAGLRCLVCQNETIDESNASLAHDIRMLLRERLTAGDTDQQAVKAIVDRYGEFVLLDPPVRPATYVLWFGPAAILLGGLLGGAVWLRRRSVTNEAAVPLSPDERDRLDTILREADR